MGFLILLRFYTHVHIGIYLKINSGIVWATSLNEKAPEKAPIYNPSKPHSHASSLASPSINHISTTLVIKLHSKLIQTVKSTSTGMRVALGKAPGFGGKLADSLSLITQTTPSVICRERIILIVKLDVVSICIASLAVAVAFLIACLVMMSLTRECDHRKWESSLIITFSNHERQSITKSISREL